MKQTKDAQSKGERRRAEIVEIARTVLTTEGFGAFTLRDIASRAAMKLGNLQYYFPSKESLLEAIIRAEAAQDLNLLVGELHQVGEPKAQIACFCETIITRWHGESGTIFTLMSFLANESELFATIYEEVYKSFYAELVPILKSIDPGRTIAVYNRRAMLITALIDGAPAQVTQGKPQQLLKDVTALAVSIATGD